MRLSPSYITDSSASGISRDASRKDRRTHHHLPFFIPPFVPLLRPGLQLLVPSWMMRMKVLGWGPSPGTGSSIQALGTATTAGSSVVTQARGSSVRLYHFRPSSCFIFWTFPTSKHPTCYLNTYFKGLPCSVSSVVTGRRADMDFDGTDM